MRQNTFVHTLTKIFFSLPGLAFPSLSWSHNARATHGWQTEAASGGSHKGYDENNNKQEEKKNREERYWRRNEGVWRKNQETVSKY